MNRANATLLAAAILSCAANLSAAAQLSRSAAEISDVLRGVDTCRMPVSEGRMQAGVTLVSGSTSAPEVTFEIKFSKSGARRMETLVGPRKGQRVLLTNDGYWLFMPGAKNAVRLTQLQRLLGQASFGDVGRIRFADEYAANEVAPLEAGLLKFHLMAHDKSNPYRKVILTVDAADNCPIEAVFMFPSGKVFKTVRFGQPSHEGDRIMIREMRFVDQTDPGKYASIGYSDLEAADLPDQLFTPDDLSRK